MRNDSSIKGADYAREAIALVASNRNADARETVAKAAVRIGNYTQEAKALWQAYIDRGFPFNRSK